MKRKKLPFSLRIFHGAIGKRFVVKHYQYGIIKTKFPDMTNIVATPQQFLCRNLFKDAVEYAKTVIADPVRKAAWQNTLKRRNGVYNEAIKEYMNKARLEKQRAATATRRLIVRAFKNQPADEMIGTATYNVGKAPAILTTSHRNLIGTRCKNQDQKNRINSGYKWKSINQTQH